MRQIIKFSDADQKLVKDINDSESDHAKRFRKLESLAEEGNIYAKFYYGISLLKGLGTEVNREEGVKALWGCTAVDVYPANSAAIKMAEDFLEQKEYEKATQCYAYAAHTKPLDVRGQLISLLDWQPGYAHWGLYRYFISSDTSDEKWKAACEHLRMAALFRCPPAMILYALFKSTHHPSLEKKTLKELLMKRPQLGVHLVRLLESKRYPQLLSHQLITQLLTAINCQFRFVDRLLLRFLLSILIVGALLTSKHQSDYEKRFNWLLLLKYRLLTRAMTRLSQQGEFSDIVFYERIFHSDIMPFFYHKRFYI